jgi:ABC-type nitrate/sulfonate/bicarbonate transport system substrate-binding protein
VHNDLDHSSGFAATGLLVTSTIAGIGKESGMHRAVASLWSMIVAVFGLMVTISLGESQETKLRVNVFPSPQNLPLYVAQEKGLFSKRGLSIEIQVTPNSQAQRDGLLKGNFEIAQAGVDNALALVDVAKADVVIVSGGSTGLNELVVRPEIKSYADIRGKTVVVDAPNTAFALILYKMLDLHGIKKGEYGIFPAGACSFRLNAMRADTSRVAAMMNPPCSTIAKRDGFTSFGMGTDVIGPYLADGHWVLRSWAKANADTLVRYLQTIIEAYRWGTDLANRAEVVATMAKYLKIKDDLAAHAVELEVGPNGGLAKDAGFDMVGFRNTLKLRAELEGGDPNADPGRYIDLSYYRRALEAL